MLGVRKSNSEVRVTARHGFTVISDAAEEKSSDNSDSDAEPDAVTFSDSRRNVLDRVRTAIRQIERGRQQLKAKRQMKDSVYKEQKVWY